MRSTRPAYDLRNKYCRGHLYEAIKDYGLFKAPWKLVIKDTWNRVCSKPKENKK